MWPVTVMLFLSLSPKTIVPSCAGQHCVDLKDLDQSWLVLWLPLSYQCEWEPGPVNMSYSSPVNYSLYTLQILS